MTTAHNQPQYNFLTGSPPPSNPGSSRHGSSRVSNAPKPGSFSTSPIKQITPQPTDIQAATHAPDSANEEWRAQIHKLQYEIDSLKQEQDAAALRHEEELRRTQARAEADFKRAQAAESSSTAALSRYETVAEELQTTQEQFSSERRELEKRFRAEQEQNVKFQEELEDLRMHHASQERQFQHEHRELEARLKTSEQTATDLRADRDEKATTLQTLQSRLSQREVEAGDLENEMLRLKTQTGDSDSLIVLKRELADQVAHIKELESTALDQRIELTNFRKHQKAIEIVEEEKRALESKARMMADLRKELSEAQLQKQILEDDRKSWTSYLEKAASDDQDLRFDSPEDLAKAFVKERFEKANLIDELGKVSPELNAKDEVIRSLEDEVAKLKESAANVGPSLGGADVKARSRLERQRTLAMKEVEYLRAQLKAFDTEETETEPGNYDEQRAKRLLELEALVDNYRAEIQTLHEDLDKGNEASSMLDPAPKTPKRSRGEEDHDERIGELFRKNRTLQETLSRVETSKSILENELEACKSQLESMKITSRTRVLELRDNPTATSQAVKQSQLNALRSENEALLSELRSGDVSATSAAAKSRAVPASTLARLRGEMDVQNDALNAKEKHIARLKQIFSSKSKEFREAVASILGWKFDFMPNGRVRVTSLFHPGVSEEEGGEGSNSIVFDGDNETMKVSGGPQSAFAGEIRPLVEFWVDGRNEIPCFLAACTLEFWERSTRAQKV